MASDKRWPKVCSFFWSPSQPPRVQPARLLFSLSKWPLNSLTEGSVLCVFTWQLGTLRRCLLCETAEMRAETGFLHASPCRCLSLNSCSSPLSPSHPLFFSLLLPPTSLSPWTSPFPLFSPPPPCPFSSFLLCVYLHTHPFTHALKAQHEFPFHLILVNLSGDWQSGPHSWIPGWNHLCLSF